MQVVVTKSDLLRVLGRCQGVANKKSTMPVLGTVLLEVDGPDRLRLAATDLYLAVSATIPAQVEKGGSIALGARDLMERVRQMPEGPIAIETNASLAATLRSLTTKRRYTVHGIAAEDFPALPEPDASAPIMELPVSAIVRLTRGTDFSISPDETRLNLNSALFEWDGDRVRMVSTDGHRLTKMELAVPGKTASASMLVPRKGVSELRRLCEEPPAETEGDTEPRLRMSQSGPNAFFQIGTLRLSIKLVDTQFPPYQQVIPSKTSHQVRAPRETLAEALQAVSVAADNRTSGVKVTLANGLLRLSSESAESGEGFDEIPVDYDGEEVTIGFNAHYFVEVLKAVQAAVRDDEVVLAISGELDPAVIKPANPAEGDEYVAVIMPMRI